LKIGVALGAGSAKGLAHIGVLQVLEENGIKPDVVTGTSMGSVIGGAYASRISLWELEKIALSIKKENMKKLLPRQLSLKGMVSNEGIREFLTGLLGDRKIEELPLRFGCVAADIYTGEEFRITKGPIVDAILASSAIPGFFPVVEYDGRFLADGGLVNPIPVNLARALGADFVIGVNVISRVKKRMGHRQEDDEEENFVERMKRALRRLLEDEEVAPPNMLTVYLSAIDIMEEQIVVSKLRLYPPDVFIHIDTSDFSSKEYYRAGELIDKGRRVTQKIVNYVKYLIDAFSG